MTTAAEAAGYDTLGLFYYVTYTKFAPGNVPTGTCGAPNLLVDSTTNLEVKSHEFRINADINDSTSLTAGVFMSDTELTE